MVPTLGRYGGRVVDAGLVEPSSNRCTVLVVRLMTYRRLMPITDATRSRRQVMRNYHGCIPACNECADARDRRAAACLSDGSATEMASCLALDIDRAAVCRLGASMMSRSSEVSHEFC